MDLSLNRVLLRLFSRNGIDMIKQLSLILMNHGSFFAVEVQGRLLW